MSKTSTIIMATVTAIFLAACAKEPPKCSDEDTFSLIRKIVLEQIGGSEGLTEVEIKENMKIELPRASAFDEKIKKYSCEAKLVVGGIIQLPITYESQLDDKNQHIVSVGGIGRGDLIAVQSGMIEGIKKSRELKEGQTKPGDFSAINSGKLNPNAQGLNFIEPIEIKSPLKTRFGVISISEEKILLFNGKPLSPTIQGNNNLSLVDRNEGGQSDVVLVQDTGGTACPAQYYFISISSAGAKSSKVFGTCSDLLKTAKKGEEILVFMQGVSESETHVFSLSGENVLDNGKLIQ